MITADSLPFSKPNHSTQIIYAKFLVLKENLIKTVMIVSTSVIYG